MLIHPAEARRQFLEYAASEITNANLARGALLIALEDNPGIDLEASLLSLDDLATRAARRSFSGEPPIFRLGHLHAEMFEVDKYCGDWNNYYDPRNAYLNDVIERRIGLPITLSIVFLHVAEKLGLVASGVGLPGHYLVKVQFELSEVFVDPFQRGETLTMPEIAAMLSSMTGGATQLASDHLRAWTGRSTLMRVLANLENMWGRAGDSRRANAARQRMEILAG